jgi:hypothetical protein
MMRGVSLWQIRSLGVLRDAGDHTGPRRHAAERQVDPHVVHAAHRLQHMRDDNERHRPPAGRAPEEASRRNRRKNASAATPSA